MQGQNKKHALKQRPLKNNVQQNYCLWKMKFSLGNYYYFLLFNCPSKLHLLFRGETDDDDDDTNQRSEAKLLLLRITRTRPTNQSTTWPMAKTPVEREK